jgi:hypothetical protein
MLKKMFSDSLPVESYHKIGIVYILTRCYNFKKRKIVPERKLEFFVKIKEEENFNHRHTLSISMIKI